MLDWGVVFGLTGIAVGASSLVYARAQAKAARGQETAAMRAALIEVNEALRARTIDNRSRIAHVPALIQEYARSNPTIGRDADAVGGLESFRVLRDLLDHMEDVYMLRAQGVAADHTWHGWIVGFTGITRMPSFRAVFESAAERGAFDPKFREFLREWLDGRPPRDPKPLA
ncbi:MAG: hypothetical protein ACYDCK_12380 [Thermoplasmatota archaeon]